mmetsp:Transcript_11499/g.25783  ORF Transcript_11499/g.25783 Transcript_11499/m.25783 type:complete len:94 (+) Transcript_11499:345-626(+)
MHPPRGYATNQMSPVLPLLLRRRASRKDYIMRTDNLDGHAAATAAARHFLYKTIPPRARDVPSISAPRWVMALLPLPNVAGMVLCSTGAQGTK